MSSHKPGKIENGQDGLVFASALRDCLAFGLGMVDASGNSVVFNREAERMLGLPSAGGKIPLDSLPAPLPQTLRKVLSAGQTPSFGISLIVEATLPNRGPVTLSWGVQALPTETEVTGRVLVVRDLTPVRRIEQKIWRLDQLASLGTLSASMAHEIKNALVAGKTFIDLLLERHQDNELVDIVRREMARIDSIVSRMLNFVGQTKMAFTQVNLHESLEHSLRLAQPQLDSKAILLTRSFLASPEMVEGDDHELQQAFVNLFLNALEAMERNGTLAVATETVSADTVVNGSTACSTQLRVIIRDTGAGIAPQDLERLFEPFFTTKPAGTGLGLPITQRIIHEHHGDIEVESCIGEGTTFRITLPTVG
jgi:two-component system sensor histidine kinase HydH